MRARSVTLNVRLAAGFGALVVIIVGLGGVAVWNMWRVEETASSLATQYVPEVIVANGVERSSLQMAFAMRGYGYTGENAFLEEARKHTGEARRSINAAKDLSGKFANLVKLREGADASDKHLAAYENLVEQTVLADNSMERLLANMNKAAEKFVSNCDGFMRNQREAAQGDAGAGAGGEQILDRVKKIAAMVEIDGLGGDLRLANFKAQALRDPAIAQEGLKSFGQIGGKIQALRPQLKNEANIRQLDAIGAAAADYEKAVKDFIATWINREEVAKKRLVAVNGLLDAAKTVSGVGLSTAAGRANDSAEMLSSAMRITTIGLGVAVIFGIFLAYIIARGITRPLRRTIEGMNEGADQVAAASGQVAGASQQLAEGSSEQAAAIEETSSSLEEMASMTRQNAENAREANSLMGETSQVVESAGTSMKDLTHSMEDVSRASEETFKIIKTIDEIAFQTNLLALNAAVEAARAGEAGAGFAVVADEVRNLAMRAAEAARNTADLIEGTVKKIKAGTDLVLKTNDAFGKVTEGTRKVAGLVGEISAASTEQAQGIEQINRAVTEMDKVTQQNAANAEETASASEEMSAQAGQMKAFVGELSALVGGRGGNGDEKAPKEKKRTPARSEAGRPDRELSPPRAAAPRAAAHGGNAKGNGNGNGKGNGSARLGRRSQEVIPFAEDELGDM